MEHIDCVSGREREGVGRKTNVKSHKLQGKEREKRNASVERVELMDNVSPLWCREAGRVYLECVFKTQAEHLRKWGLEFAECSDCVPPGE